MQANVTGVGNGDSTNGGGNVIKTLSSSDGSGLSSILINQQVKYNYFFFSFFLDSNICSSVVLRTIKIKESFYGFEAKILKR